MSQCSDCVHWDVFDHETTDFWTWEKKTTHVETCRKGLSLFYDASSCGRYEPKAESCVRADSS